jgi:hypothetical protein
MPQPPSGEWNAFRLIMQLDSPLHCGYRALGNMKQTRPYLPGSALWGAVSARIARDFLSGKYESAGAWVNHYLRFSYLFPSTGAEEVTLWPWGETEPEFAWEFLSSYSSTSLRDGRSKLDGSLHELEQILPISRSGKPVYLVGYVWLRADDSSGSSGSDPAKALLQLRDGRPNNLAGTFLRLQLGGERRYGSGRIRTVEFQPVGENTSLFDFWVTTQSSDVFVSPANDNLSPLFAHTVDQTSGGARFVDGALEPLMLRRICEGEKHGYNLTKPVVCWAPGTLARLASGMRFTIGDGGIWYLHSRADQRRAQAATSQMT